MDCVEFYHRSYSNIYSSSKTTAVSGRNGMIVAQPNARKWAWRTAWYRTRLKPIMRYLVFGDYRVFRGPSRPTKDEVEAADRTKHEADAVFRRAPSLPRGFHGISA